MSTRKVAVESVDAVRRKLTIEIDEAEVSAEVRKMFSELTRSARVNGFRQGRVPRPVLERMFGDRVRADVFANLIQASYSEALHENHIEPVAQPEITTEESAPGNGLRYAAVVEVRPEIELGNYDGLEAERVKRKVSDEQLATFLDGLRESLAQLVPVTDRTLAQPGDVATVDYDALAGERLLTRRKDRRVEVTADGDQSKFGSNLNGMEIGAEKTFEVDYPADYSERELAGQRVTFNVKVGALARKDVPPLDDEFAKDHGECETLEELREKVRQHLESEANQEAERRLHSTLIKKLADAHDIAVPASMLIRRQNLLVEQFFESLGAQRPPASREAEIAAQLRERFEPEAREQVKATLILDAIVEREKLELPEDELDAAIDLMVRRGARGADVERVRAYYSDPAVRAGLKSSMLQDRAVALVASRAKVTTVEQNSSVAEVG